MSFHNYNPNNFRPLSFYKNKDLNELNKDITQGRLFCDNSKFWADDDIKLFCDDEQYAPNYNDYDYGNDYYRAEWDDDEF